MAKVERKEPIKIINPRYAGATPKDVARALLKHDPKGVKKVEKKEFEAADD